MTDLSQVSDLDLYLELHKRDGAVIRWAPDDIQTLKPHWTLEQCAEWLQNHASAIEDRSIELGWEVIECLIS